MLSNSLESMFAIRTGVSQKRLKASAKQAEITPVDDGSACSGSEGDSPRSGARCCGPSQRDGQNHVASGSDQKDAVAGEPATETSSPVSVFDEITAFVERRSHTYFPVMESIRFKSSMRPQRPSLFRAAWRTAGYLRARVMGDLPAGIERNKRVFDGDLRKTIMSSLQKVEKMRQPTGHSHPDAAAERTGVSHAFLKAVRSAGLTPYVVSASSRDGGEGRARGCRQPFFEKDLASELFLDPVLEDDVLIFVDVDYYTAMPRWLEYGRPMLIYTQVAESAAGTYPGGQYELREGVYVDRAGCASYKGTVMCNRVDGGANYFHPLWDYSRDSVSVVDFWGNLIVYTVESRQLPSGRRIVGMFPTVSVPYPYWKQTDYSTLERFEALHDGIPVVERGDGSLSIGQPGTFDSYEITRLDYMAVVTKLVAAKSQYVGDVERYLRISANERTSKRAREWAPAVFNLVVTGWRPEGSGYVCKTSAVAVFESTPNHYVASHPADDGKSISGSEIARAFAPALCTDPAPCPAAVVANAAAAHKLRVADTQVKFAGHVVARDCKGYSLEFVDRVLGARRGTVVPLTLAELETRWIRPSQREGLRHVHTMLDDPAISQVMKGFLKKEPGYKPRQIVNCDPAHNAPLGCFSLAIMADLKEHHRWVGCGLSPESIERRVREVAKGECLRSAAKYAAGSLTTAHEGDITNCDGSELRWHRDHICDPILLGLTEPSLRHVLRALLKEEKPPFTVKMKEGYTYQAAWELISGTSLTTVKNILKVAFGDYVALRRCKLSPQEAFDALGIYCGDDSVQVALDIPCLHSMRVAALKDLGMDQKLLVRSSPDPVTFLGEYHFGAFADGGGRLPDFWRQVAKCHLTTNAGVTLAQAAANKAAGALAGAARNDPVLGPWFLRVRELCGARPSRASMSREEQWNLDNKVSDYQVSVDDWCRVVGVDRTVVDDVLKKIAKATSLDTLPGGLLSNLEHVKPLLPGVDASGSTTAPAPPDSNVQVEVPKAQAARRGGGRGTAAAAVAQPQAAPRRGRGRGTQVVQRNPVPVRVGRGRGSRP